MAAAAVEFGKAVIGFIAGNTIAQGALVIAGSALAARAAAPNLSAESVPDQARDTVINATVEPHNVIYGEAYTGGVLMYGNTGTDSTYADDRYMHLLVAVAAHEVDDITDIELDGTELSDGVEIDWSNNVVDSGKYAPDTRSGRETVKLWKQLGTSTQTALSELTSLYGGDITSTFRGRGLAQVLFRYHVSDLSDELWQAGFPSRIRVKVRGRKVYDPRLDSTNGGSGSHRQADPSTWAWSDNPILCAVDYARHFKRPRPIAFARIDWDSVRAEADVCDVMVDIPPAASPANQQKRYTCNGNISLGNTNRVNMEQIMSSCMGRRVKVGGLWRFLAGAYHTPTETVDEDNIIGQVALSTTLTQKERFNRCSAKYIDASQGHIENECQPIEIAAYVTRDNSTELPKVLDLPMTNNEYMAQRICWKTLNQADMRQGMPLNTNWSGYRLTPGVPVQMTYDKFGFTSKVFQVTNWRLIGGGAAPVSLVLREDDSTAWADPDVSDYTTKTAAGAVVPGDGDYAGFARNVTTVFDRASSEVVAEVFELNNPETLRQQHMDLAGHETDPRLTGSLYGGADGGTVGIDMDNMEIGSGMSQSGGGELISDLTKNTTNLYSDTFDLNATQNSGSVVEKWNQVRDGSAPITLLSSGSPAVFQEFEADRAALMLVTLHLVVTLTIDIDSVTQQTYTWHLVPEVDTGGGFASIDESHRESHFAPGVGSGTATRQAVISGSFPWNAASGDKLRFSIDNVSSNVDSWVIQSSDSKLTFNDLIQHADP